MEIKIQMKNKKPTVKHQPVRTTIEVDSISRHRLKIIANAKGVPMKCLAAEAITLLLNKNKKFLEKKNVSVL